MSSPHALWLAAILFAYLVGSVPIGLLLGRLRGVDIREHGSGNIGATNVMRVLGRRLGSLCFVLDVLKGALPVLIAGRLAGVLGAGELTVAETLWWLLVAAASVLGHMYPVWLRFRGGKGVATGFGAMLGMWPHLTIPALLGLGVWIILAVATRYVGVSSCVAAASFALWTLILRRPAPDEAGGAWVLIIAAAILAALVIVRHRSNIARTMAGTEPRIGARPRTSDGAPPNAARPR